jgi:hypothetical protein
MTLYVLAVIVIIPPLLDCDTVNPVEEEQA